MSGPDYSLIPVTSPKRKRTLAALPTFYLANGKKFLQRSRLPVPLGQVGLQERRNDVLTSTSRTRGEDDSDIGEVTIVTDVPNRHSRKRLAQFQHWKIDVIPKLRKPYMKLLRETENLKQDPVPSRQECTCMNMSSELSVLVVRFCALERIQLNICACRTAAVQLVERGLFPCAPLQPSLAVDMRVLDFVSRLFLRISPNTTALANTIHDFLCSQGYNMEGEDPLRRRFGNALQWYISLQDSITQFMDSLLSATRSLLLGDPEPSKDWPEVVDEELTTCEELTDKVAEYEEEEDEGEHNDEDEGEQDDEDEGEQDNEDEGDEDEDDGDEDDDDDLDLTRPSEYLRARCPLCFGGNSTMSGGLSAIVCIDACFTQKHNKQQHRDPPREHPRTVFVPESDVKSWEDFVARTRPSTEKRRMGKQSTAERVDACEGPLKVPNSVLDECEQSFTAADETREKASSQFFDSTALMGLLCRHDRVLWLVNMTSPGERQHYALTLIDILFRHLPRDWTVGVLYDIGCQIHRSCVRWGFLEKYLDRITFAISVFHAYGHGWACQCVYHPRKCVGFGLSDGEGCERFWHSISKLIAYLRVCGHHLRLYTLDSQVNHAASENLTGIGKWLARKWHNAEQRYLEADAEVKGAGHEVSLLRDQWKTQVAVQTKPLPRQSKEAGRKAVENALRLKKTSEMLVARISKLDDILSDLQAEDYEVVEAETQLPVLQKKLSETRSALVREERKLGVEDKATYRHLARSPFINLRMNARAIKIRLRSRLAARKFERDRLERTFRRQQYNDRRVHHHTEDSVKKRDPSIQKLARQYNSLCTEMQRLITLNRAPRNARSPPLIPMKDLFNLDVDDEIWQDVGLDDVDSQSPPLWLSDDKVRSGIKAVLVRDRCNEELLRLKHELCSLQQWVHEEWDIIMETIDATSDPGILH
ncbi:hypothetical protein C8R42DRAFT_587027 [Lentinula raphanica]|nr:hypothetical protein C8R42DRAFT_587027 [Lentinula raphanica]